MNTLFIKDSRPVCWHCLFWTRLSTFSFLSSLSFSTLFLIFIIKLPQHIFFHPPLSLSSPHAVWPRGSHQVVVWPSVYWAHQDSPNAWMQWRLNTCSWSRTHVEPHSGKLVLVVNSTNIPFKPIGSDTSYDFVFVSFHTWGWCVGITMQLVRG